MAKGVKVTIPPLKIVSDDNCPASRILTQRENLTHTPHAGRNRLMCAIGEKANFRRVAALSDHRRKLVKCPEGPDVYEYYPSFCVKAN